VALLLSFSAMASDDVYDCSAYVPKGKATLAVRTELDGSQKIRVVFTNELRNQTHIGTLEVLENSSNGLLAVGDLLAYELRPVISVTLQGSFVPDDGGAVSVVLYARADHRIEYGYGNPLHCQKR
jgi:hypothetical protein